MDSVFGLLGSEIVTLTKNFAGNSSADFQTFVETMLPLAEARFCNVHDWSFLNKRNLSLTVVSGTNEYALNSTTVSYFIPAAGVQNIFSEANGIYLEKTTLDALRRMDPDSNDGTATTKLSHWAPVADNTIILYPKTFSDTTLKVDGKIFSPQLTSVSNYPIIPFRYQDSFIKYVFSLAMWRENDERSEAAKQEALTAINMDIQSDLQVLSAGADDRIRHGNETRFDGVSGNLDALYNLWAFNSP